MWQPPRKCIYFSLLVAAVLALGACSSKTTVKSDLGIADAPDWVNKGSTILDDKGGRLFHGVGSAPAMGDQSLQISTADDRARSELARVLSTYMDVVSRDFRAASGSGDDVSGEQNITRQINALTKVNLTGAEIIGHWNDKHTGIIYSIAELDMKRVKETLDHVKDMDSGLKKYIQNNADNIFDRMRSTGE
jgi:hypothetical protein